jgi:hypothetical protein
LSLVRGGRGKRIGTTGTIRHTGFALKHTGLECLDEHIFLHAAFQLGNDIQTG